MSALRLETIKYWFQWNFLKKFWVLSWRINIHFRISKFRKISSKSGLNLINIKLHLGSNNICFQATIVIACANVDVSVCGCIMFKKIALLPSNITDTAFFHYSLQDFHCTVRLGWNGQNNYRGDSLPCVAASPRRDRAVPHAPTPPPGPCSQSCHQASTPPLHFRYFHYHTPRGTAAAAACREPFWQSSNSQRIRMQVLAAARSLARDEPADQPNRHSSFD